MSARHLASTLAWLLAAPLWAASPATPATGARAAALYDQHCQACHGADRLGGMGPALLPQSLERLKPG